MKGISLLGRAVYSMLFFFVLLLVPAGAGADPILPDARFGGHITTVEGPFELEMPSAPGTYALGAMSTTITAFPRASLTAHADGTVRFYGAIESFLDYSFAVNGPQTGVPVPMLASVNLRTEVSGTGDAIDAASRFVLVAATPGGQVPAYNILLQSTANHPNYPNAAFSSTLPFGQVSGGVGSVHLQIDLRALDRQGGGLSDGFADAFVFIDPAWLSTHPGYSVSVSPNVGNTGPAVPADAGPDQTVDEGASVQLDGCGTLADADYAWTQVAGSPSVTLSGANGCSPTFTAPEVPAGGAVLTFQLTVTRGAASGSDTVDVLVKNLNHPPVTSAGNDQQVNEGTPVILDGSNTFDPDGDSLTYAWVQTAGVPVTLSDPSAVSPTFDAPFLPSGSAILTFQLTASDGALGSSDAVQIAVENVNHPPTAEAGEDRSMTQGGLVTLDGGLSSDPDGNLGLDYLWTWIQGPVVALTGQDEAVATFSPVEAGTYRFRLRVTDAGGLTDEDEVTIVALPANDPPACAVARPTVPYLWPPNHKMIEVGIAGVTGAGGDAVTMTIVSVRQDEPINGLGDGDTSPDAVIQGSAVLLRAERSGTGNGRYYHIQFLAERGTGGSCTGTVKVFVPHDMSKPVTAVDGGSVYDSRQP